MVRNVLPLPVMYGGFDFTERFFFLLAIFFLTVRGLGLIDQGRAHPVGACLQLFPARLTFITSLTKSTTFLLLGLSPF